MSGKGRKEAGEVSPPPPKREEKREGRKGRTGRQTYRTLVQMEFRDRVLCLSGGARSVRAVIGVGRLIGGEEVVDTRGDLTF